MRTHIVTLGKDVVSNRVESNRSDKPLKRMTKIEIAEKRAKGLCFRCDEKFSPRARCKGMKLQMLTMGDEDEYEECRGFLVLIITERNGVNKN